MTRSRLRHRILAAGQEITLIAGLYLLYRIGRIAIVGQEAIARANAEIVRRDEAWLHLPSEALIQTEVGSQTLYRLANTYYVSFHFPVAIAFLVLGYVIRPRLEYRWARNLIAVQTGLALLIHIVFPLAPPRMFTQWGFVDTMTVYGPSAYQGAAATAANQFAAMPSLHVGWAVLIAFVVARTGPRWLAIPAGLHALVTVAVVTVTANHWWLDGVVAVALLGVALAVFPQPGHNRLAMLRVSAPRPVPASPHPVFASPHPALARPNPVTASPKPMRASPHPAPASPDRAPARANPAPASPHPAPASPRPAAASLHPVPASPRPVFASPHPGPGRPQPVPAVADRVQRPGLGPRQEIAS